MKKYTKYIIVTNVFALTLALFSGCKSNNEEMLKIDDIITEEIEVNPEKLDIKSIMTELTGKDYLTRVPGMEENVRTSIFIKNYFEEIGLKPLREDGYYDNVEDHSFTKKLNRIRGNFPVDNVLGVIEGKDRSKAVVISAHFDHVYLNESDYKKIFTSPKEVIKTSKLPGALDNISGVATMLRCASDIAEYYKENKPEYDIIFAAFNAEELGLLGAKSFVKEYKDKYTDWYNINIDCIGVNNGEGLTLKTENKICMDLYNDFKDVLDKEGIYYEDKFYASDEKDNIVGTSDHMEFREYDDASIIIGQDRITDIAHTKDDNLSIIDFELIEDIKDALVKFIIETDGTIY